jgi:hypothetical protein
MGELMRASREKSKEAIAKAAAALEIPCRSAH